MVVLVVVGDDCSYGGDSGSDYITDGGTNSSHCNECGGGEVLALVVVIAVVFVMVEWQDKYNSDSSG